MNDLSISFQIAGFGDKSNNLPVMQKSTDKILEELKVLAGSDVNILNALNYLKEKGFIYFDNFPDNISLNFINFRIASPGIDIVEAVERGEDEQDRFTVNFNIKIENKNNLNVESLIKTELGGLNLLSLKDLLS